MGYMDSRWARVARGATAASVATFVAAFSHWLSGGIAPSWFGVGVSLVISMMICTMLAGRTLSTARLAISIGVSQVLFHALFSGLGTPVALDHEMGAMDAALPHLHAAPTMWLAHAVAALVTVVAFRFGERAFWGVAGTARLFLARLLVVVAPLLDVPRPVVAVQRRFIPRDLSLLLSSMRHRGPPVELSA
jgi:F0F1-type ATP synthase assembly protein I